MSFLLQHFFSHPRVRSGLALLLCLCTFYGSMASSHREAPLIANDPLADNVDLYAFRSPDNPDMVTIIATYVPMQLPFGGPNYYSFGENIRYEIHIDNDLAVNRDEIIYRFTFQQSNDDPTTFFNVRLGAENLRTTYTLERSTNGGASFQAIITDGVVPPYNIGPRSIEGAAGLGTTYETLFQNAITTAGTGEKVFAGSVDDPFFVDLGGVFDLGDAPRQNGTAVDGLACLNTSALAIQVPISTLLKRGAPSEPTSILDSDYVIGVWASASRQAIRTIFSDNEISNEGLWRQVSRLGMPLTNEVVIPIGQKDLWNSISPYEELEDRNLDQYFYNPELALYMDDDQFGGAVPALAPLRIQKNSLGAFDFSNGGDGLYSLKGSDAVEGTALDDDVFGTLLLPSPGNPRSVDLWPTFHTGVPNVRPYQLATGKDGDPLAEGKPFVNNFLPNGGDMLRLNMAVPPTPRDDPNFSSLGLIQAAVLGLTTAPYNETADLEFIPNMDGFPNGRRLEDDVTRIELQAVAGAVLAAVGLWYDDFDPASGNPVTEDLLNVITYSTGVEANDKEFQSTFPYLAMPTRGTDNCFADLFGGDNSNEEPVAADTVARFFASSNTSGMIGAFAVLDNDSITCNQFASAGEDADGIFYDKDTDVLYQLNRSDNVVNGYGGALDSLSKGSTPVVTATSSSDFINGREIAVSGNKLIVAQDANDGNGNVNAFHVYTTAEDSITLERTVPSPINLWGIHLEMNTLYAIEDNSDRVAVFTDFCDIDSLGREPSQLITIAGMGRTHGITYESSGDILVLTDIGDAMSDSDGGFTIIKDFAAKSADGIISLEEQIRVDGDSSQLGNPVDIAIDTAQRLVFVAERAQDGGKILAFSMPTETGDASPIYSKSFPGASAVNLMAENPGLDNEGPALDTMPRARVYLSSNTSGRIAQTDVLEDTTLRTVTFASQGMDADGIYYDDEADVLYQLNRTDNVINAYSNVQTNLTQGMDPELTATSSSDFVNGREIAAAGGLLVMAEDGSDANGMQNRLLVYEISPTAITLRNSYDVDINLWGIYVDVNTVYAIEDNSDRVAVFEDFFSNADTSTIIPDLSVTIADMSRTHGITYVREGDVMVLTDVADAMSDSDGAFTIISDFSMKAEDGMIDSTEQQIVEGDSTQLGNPVDIAYDTATQLVYIVERAQDGGKLLVFSADAEGNQAPVAVDTFSGASAIFLVGSLSEEDPSTAVVNLGSQSFEINAFPNPATDMLRIQFKGNLELYRGSQLELLTIDGKMLRRQEVNSSRNEVELQGLGSGIYFIKIYRDDFVHTIKVSKL